MDPNPSQLRQPPLLTPPLTPSKHLGHSSVTITLDRYGHLLPGNETEAAELLETWLDKTTKTLQV
jgi:integrase